MKSFSPTIFLLLVACANPSNVTPITDIQLYAVLTPTTAPIVATQTGAALAPPSIDPATRTMQANLSIATTYPCSLSPSFGISFENDPFVKYVLDHIDEAHPLLLDMLRKYQINDFDRAFRILAIAGKPESIPLMKKLLLSNKSWDLVKSNAGKYLGLHPAPEAFEILLSALTTTDTNTLVGATLGLIERKDTAACPPLRKQMTRTDDSQRYDVIQAASALGCLTTQDLTDISVKDQSSEVRYKTKELLKTNQGSADDDRED
jgi:hypothetical protein